MTSNYRHLSQAQRYQIEALLKAGHTQRYVADIIGVHKSTICRELKRNSIRNAHPPDHYKAANAHNFSIRRAYKADCSQSSCPAISRRIVFLLKNDWSPQQICKVCRNRLIPMLSTEGIYLWIYAEKLKGNDLTHLLRRRHRKRRKRALNKQPRATIAHKTPIALRSKEVENEQRIGDWEADLVKCTNGYVVTMTERKTLFNLIAIVPHKTAQLVANAIIKLLEPYKDRSHTITSDNGTEFAAHQYIAHALGIKWFFADPYCSQQRGRNENQNGLIRQYLKRNTDLSITTDQQILNIQNKLNCRPRKKNIYQPPKILFLNLKPKVALAA